MHEMKISLCFNVQNCGKYCKTKNFYGIGNTTYERQIDRKRKKEIEKGQNSEVVEEAKNKERNTTIIGIS